MTTIKATPNPSTASVQLIIDTTSPVLRVLRSDTNGISEVRALKGQLPSAANTQIILDDYEAAAGTNLYSVDAGSGWQTVRTNLITNPSFESNTNGYSGTAATISRDTAFKKTGLASLKVVPTGAARGYVSAGEYPVFPGQTFTMSLWVYVPTALSVPFYPVIEFYGDFVNYSYKGNAQGTAIQSATGTGTFTRFTVTGTVPAGAYGLIPYIPISIAIPKTTDIFYIDSILLERSAVVGEYFDGSIAATATTRYKWTGIANASTSVAEVENPPTQTATVSLNLESPWLLVPVLPNYSEAVRTITNYGSQRQSQSTVHSVIGRPDPLLAFGVLSDRTGALEIFCDSLAQARTLETVFNRAEVVMLKQNVSGLDMYFTASSTNISPYSVEGEQFTKYSLSVSYTEMKRPIGDLAGALGWTLAELAKSYASFDAVTMKFASFNDLTIRKEK